MSGKLLDDAFIAELAEIVRYRRKNGLWGGAYRNLMPALSDAPILVKNSEAEEIPAYGCMQVVDTLDEDGRNYIKVQKPDSTGVTFIFNSSRAIESEGYGVGFAGPICRGYKNSGTVSESDRWAPTASQWYLTKGPGPFVAIGLDDVADNVFRFSVDYSPQFLLATLTTAWTGTTASADLYSLGDVSLGINATINDPLSTFSALTTGDRLEVKRIGMAYYTNQAPCPA